MAVGADVAIMSKTPSHRSLIKTSRSSSDNTSLHSQASSYFNDSFVTKSPTLDAQQWQAAALSMGINPSDTGPAVDQARKASKKADKRAKKMAEVMSATIDTVAQSHESLHVTVDNLFNREAIPSFTPRLDSTANRRMGLLPPRPATTVGYSSQVFTNDQRELQHGIISDVDCAPRDLGKLSHACRETYWPFLVVEVSDVSLQAASDLAVEATATCNNALMTLASALLDPTSGDIDPRLTAAVNRGIASFALAIHKKVARLIVHYSDGFIGDNAGILQTYNLDLEHDMSSLLRRLKNIFVWAEDVRLKAIEELLDVLDRRVSFRECIKTQDTSVRGPMDVPGVGRLHVMETAGDAGKGGLFKSVIGSSMPGWSRVEM